ncbi:4-hydroxy-tetrahydrodipicolinate reductase [Planctomicrobium sp. SH661]|uniref:4-hydroxy-tetrahydrodipicolinate reductase n=1 Tax=Planctomicrobium sp. SH661 TaxID=3448124 RepID=UPI003F5B6E8F
MSEKIRIAIHGAAGRMGQRLIALAHVDPALQVVAALEHAGSPALGKDAGEHAGIGKIGVPITAELTGRVDAIIDFSVPEAAVRMAALCAERRIPLVEATTGLTPEQKGQILSAAQETAVVFSPSMSMAVNLAMKLVGEAAKGLKNLPSGVDVEIVERHHRFKEDAPSGTALKFGQIVAEEMGQTNHVHGREGQTGKRPQNEIGYHALRTGDNVGEHQIVFGMLGETLEVYVRGHTRDSYAYGALAAAKFASAKPAGLYTMADVLGLT